MPSLQTFVNEMLDEFDGRFGTELDRSILISTKVRSQLPSHGSNAQLHQTRASIAVQATYRGAIVDAVPHDREWLVAIVPVVLETGGTTQTETLYGDVRSGLITEDFEELEAA